MKKILLLFTAFLIFSFATTGDAGMKLKATAITPIGADKCSVALELHNGFDRKINFLSMYCSDEGFYVTDNADVVVVPKPCDKNFPTSVPIARNTYRASNLELKILKNTKSASFKIGFRFIEIPNNLRISEFDSASVKGVTIWSNTIAFKSR